MAASNLEWQSMFNVGVALMGIVLSTLLLVHIQKGQPWEALLNFSFLIYICLLLFAAANLLEQLLSGNTERAAVIGMRIATFCDYLFSGLLTYAVSGLLFSRVDPDWKLQPLRWLVRWIVMVDVVLLIVSQFTGLYYHYSEQNVYLRSDSYMLSLLPPALMVLVNAVVLLRYRSRLTIKEKYAFWSFILIPIAALVLQVFLQNIVPLAAIVASLVLYFYLMEDQTERFYRQQEENLKLRTEIMLSQIQPHFLYNSLGAIADLCQTDPKTARETTIKFSQYLRGNMNAIASEQAIPFLQELDHTKRYLELEQVRFGDDLQVRYDVECTDFLLPTLSLQPLAENAVLHGVRRNPGGCGSVVISTRERETYYEISVTDDGPGFFTGQVSKRQHIGLQNVRERLRLVCGGTLEIAQNGERGTRATICIPKERGKADADPRD